MNQSFPSDADFEKSQISRPVIKWSQLPQGIYKIIRTKEVATSHGGSMIISLVTSSSEEEVNVWAPDRLVEILRNKPNIRYLRNNGLKVSLKNTTHKYHSFDWV